MRYKIYASDEGFGHLVRQRAINDQLRALQPGLDTTRQTGRFMRAARLIQGYERLFWDTMARIAAQDGNP